MKEAPFNIGQKVVCVISVEVYEKDKTYIVKKLENCLSCGRWYVGSVPHSYTIFLSECMCGEQMPDHAYLMAESDCFAPIEENTYENISKELAVLPQDEVPDVKEIKELVN